MPDETRHESEDLEDYQVQDSTDTLSGGARLFVGPQAVAVDEGCWGCGAAWRLIARVRVANGECESDDRPTLYSQLAIR